MPASLWDAAIRTLLIAEGGWVDNPSDPGGETKYGISKRSYPNLDIRNLTVEQAVEIYHRDYWLRIPDELPDKMRWFLFDCAVNHGVTRALEWLGKVNTFDELVAHRISFFTGLSTFSVFGKGWMRRVSHLLYAISSWENSGDDELVRANRVVLHDLSVGDKWRVVTRGRKVLLEGNFFWRVRGSKVDCRRGAKGE